MKKNVSTVLVLLFVFLVGAFVSYFWFYESASHTQTSAKKDRKILYWVAPMNPSFRRDKPGKSPMGMDLVPVYEDMSTGADQGVIKISPVVVNNLGVKKSPVKRMDLARIIETVGYVTVDENNIEHVHTYTDGWVKKLYVKTMGESVSNGELLLELYSPMLNNAQEELLLALNTKNNSLINAGEKKLLTLGMAQSEIDKLKKTRQVLQNVKVYAANGGIVSKLNVREGMYVKPDVDLMTIEDLSHIWIIAEVFERQASWVENGQPAIATLPFIPAKTWQGHVDYVYPELNPQTHTLRVRLTFPNPDLTLKPKMYANVKILSQSVKQALAIPRSALIRTGEGDRAVVALGEGRFRSQPIKVGIESGNYFEVLNGLNENDMVVTSAQFLIDSESNVRASFGRMQANDEQLSIHEIREYVAEGKVKEIDHEKRIITLHHEPIPALHMPAMTMELSVAESVDMKNIKAGDNVDFVIVKKSDDNYLITKIHRVKNNNQSMRKQ